MAFAFPHYTKAFWPFGTPAQADSPVVVPDSSLRVLSSCTNLDPNCNQGQREIALSQGSALIPQAGPEGSIPDIAHIPETTVISSYVVQDGDTLSGIADHFNVSVNTILWANDLTVKSAIRPGQTLTILPVSGIEHTVASGETLASLAKKYGGDATEIATYNGFSVGAALTTGSKILIPGGELADSTPASTKSTSKKSSSSSSAVPGNTTGNPYRGGSGTEYDGYYINPVPGALLTQGLHGENAVDLGIARGTPIHAAAAGTVIVAKSGGGYNGGYGNYVVITHSNGSQTLYAHMTTVSAAVGQKVAQGAVIGTVGVTGDATGPHLHFEVRGARNPFVASINAGLCRLDKVCSPK